MHFTRLQLEDIETVRPFFDGINPKTCDYTIGTIMMWRDYFNVEYAIEDGMLFSRMHTTEGEYYYNLPVGNGTVLTQDLYARMGDGAETLRFSVIPEHLLEALQAGNHVRSVTEQTDFGDYIYDAQALRSFAGKKYGGQRNHVHQFEKGAASWSFEPITGENIPAVRAFFVEQYLAAAAHGSYEEEENRKVLEVLDRFDEYGMFGGALFLDGRVVGFSINEICGDMLFTHIEKADKTVHGAYQMVVQQSAQRFAPDRIAFINREEDMGDPGLRASKQSYHPTAVIPKYIVELTR